MFSSGGTRFLISIYGAKVSLRIIQKGVSQLMRVVSPVLNTTILRVSNEVRFRWRTRRICWWKMNGRRSNEWKSWWVSKETKKVKWSKFEGIGKCTHQQDSGYPTWYIYSVFKSQWVSRLCMNSHGPCSLDLMDQYIFSVNLVVEMHSTIAVISFCWIWPTSDASMRHTDSFGYFLGVL